jgi:hypothetical protein
MSSSSLPAWAQWVQFAFVLAIPAVGAWLAAQQVAIARAKLRHDLFDRRFAVFHAARSLIASIFREGDVTNEALQSYTLGIIDARFLLSVEVDEYLQSIRHRAIDLHTSKVSLEGVEDQAERRRLSDKWAMDIKWLLAQGDPLREAFGPFLRLEEVSWFAPIISKLNRRNGLLNRK